MTSLQVFVFSIWLGSSPLVEAQNCKDNARYRTLSGECNNLNNPYWGSSPRTYNVLVTQDYGEGGIVCPRESAIPNKTLPLARVLSSNIMYKPFKLYDPNGISELHIYFGMFLTHDMSLSFPTNELPKTTHPCMKTTTQCPITEMYTGGNDKYIKDTPCLTVGLNYGMYCNGSDVKNCGCTCCPAGQYQHLNFMTSYIDLSNIYAISETRNKNLRVAGTAKFVVTKDNLLPLAQTAGPNDTAVPCVQANGKDAGPCILSGEEMGNVSPFLQAMNTLFVREHNRLVDKFKGSCKDEETLFQEARRINIAIMQHIVYNEYLPSILGKCMSEDLKVPSENFEYDATIDPTVTKEFISGAFRFGHTQSKNKGSLGLIPNQVPFGQLFSNTPYMTAGPYVIEKEMKAMFYDRARRTNQYYNDQMVNQFKFSIFPPMGDLAAIDVQRGRLHGLASYLNVRRHFNLPVASNIDGLSVKANTKEDFKKYYGKDGVENLDLHLAAMAEDKVPNCQGVMFGETYKIIIEEQFRKLKFGDRFWYEIKGQPWSFTDDQLKEIRKTTLSGLICRNTKLLLAPKNGLYSTSKRKLCLKLAADTDLDISKFL